MDDNKNGVMNGYTNGTDLNGRGKENNQKDIVRKLDEIKNYLESELAEKQKIINIQFTDIAKLKKDNEEKAASIDSLREKMEACGQQVESNRQLINKLLGDISHYQNDIEWYKRTYEKRSIWGVLKEKILGEEPGKKNK